MPAGAGPAAQDTTQAERTRLAWRRTTLAPIALIGIAVARLLVSAGGRGLVAVLLMLVGWLGLYAVARRRMLALRRGQTDAVVRTPLVIASLAVAYALLGLLLLRPP